MIIIIMLEEVMLMIVNGDVTYRQRLVRPNCSFKKSWVKPNLTLGSISKCISLLVTPCVEQ